METANHWKYNESAAYLSEHHEEPDDNLEFRTFCHDQEEVRKHPLRPIENCDKPVPGEYTEDDIIILFSIAAIALYGAVVRSLLRRFKLGIPYTVILMLSGLIIGLISKYNCYQLHLYTALARTKPEIILYVFLPILVFESSYSIPAHVFVKMFPQLLIVSFPGMIISTFLTAASCLYFLPAYKWNFVEASLFGSIISATDPVAVVAILRELGTSETLGVMIEGESLLNDGVAVLLYEIFEEIVEDTEKVLLSNPKQLVGHILMKFLQIAVGGPIFGFFMGKFAVFCLSRVFNDSTVETTITIVAAYLTYFLGENILGVSGIMAVVILGITMGSERTSVSPESEKHIHHFWEMLGFLANTVLFVIVGIVITETALTDINLKDVAYLFNLYVLLTLIRLLMIVVLIPALNRVGNAIEWRNVLVMTWGGLRGAVGLCLALEVFNNPHLCERNELGPKFLFQTAGIVFLTLVINGTTTKKLMEKLGMTKITPARAEEMRNAMKHLLVTRTRCITILKQDRFLADADWDTVEMNTKITDPYKVLVLPLVLNFAKIPCTLAQKLDKFQDKTGSRITSSFHAKLGDGLTLEKYKEMTEEARLRILTALRISYWRQHEQGLIKEVAVQILVDNIDDIADKEFSMVEAYHFKKYFIIQGAMAWLHKNIHKLGLDTIDTHPPAPKERWRYGFWWLVTQKWLDGLLIVIVIFNMIPIIWEFILEAEHPGSCFENRLHFTIANFLFTLIYLFEFIFKILGFGWYTYWENRWNFIDAIVLIISILDTIISSLPCDKDNVGFEFFGIVKILRLFRISRMLLLLQPLLPYLTNFVNRIINERLFLAYDIGKGFVIGIEDVLRLLPLMADNYEILKKFKVILEEERVSTVRQMGLLQRDHPDVANSVKTKHAIRAVLNQMKQMLSELKKDGLIDEKEDLLLTLTLDEKIKRLNNFPSSIAAPSSFSILSNVPWIQKDKNALEYFKDVAVIQTFVPGDIMYKNGEEPKGIFIIVTGLVKIVFTPSKKINDELTRFGVLPNTEVVDDLSFTTESFDYFGPGTIIGEHGVLKGQERASSVFADTFVSAYHISDTNMRSALTMFNDQYDSLYARIWCSFGKKLASTLLRRHYPNMSVDKIQIYLENCAVPIWDTSSSSDCLEIPDYIADIIVIEGYFENYHSKEVYKAPCIIPKLCTKLAWKRNPLTVNRILVIVHEDIEDGDYTNDLELDCKSNDLRNLDEFVRAYSLAKENFERFDIRQRRLSVAIKHARRERDLNRNLQQ